ncbi:MAG: hypothetical protein KDA97_05230, partial [Acidimicrobiales bacterium]|nr:hypothetical protein [Acidimicrobiales bacterium]
MQRPVAGHVVEFEADAPVGRCERFVAELVEHLGGDPLVARARRHFLSASQMTNEVANEAWGLRGRRFESS